MTLLRERPGFEADERTQLLGWLDLQRAIIHWKCAGLDEADARRHPLPDSPAMSMAGLVSHLRWTEHCWFEVLFAGHSASANPQFGEVEDADWLVDADVSLASLLDDYRAQCAVSDRIVAKHELTDAGHSRAFGEGRLTLRWVLLHMIEETARHAGHADTLRELLDGTRGYY